MSANPWDEWRGNTVTNLPITIQPAALPHPSAIPPRQWLYGTRLIRRFVSVLVAPGGTGKSLYSVGVAMALASGKPILGEHVHHRVNTWCMNLEDPMDEINRRVAAMMIRHDLTRDDLDGRLFLHSGRDRRLVLAEKSSDGYDIIYPDKDGVIDAAQSQQIGAIFIDPFVKSHHLEENSNPDMDAAATAWAEVGDATGAAIFLVHHTRKGAVSDIDAARGGKALTDAARVGMTMATMSPEEAAELGIPDTERWQHVRVDDAKVNMAPKASRAQWFKLETQELGNGNDEYRHGDRVAAIAPWEPPNPVASAPISDLNIILDQIAAGPSPGILYSPSKRGGSARWCGTVAMEVLELTEGQANALVRQWLRSGLLTETKYRHEGLRRDVPGVLVDNAKRPGNTQTAL